MGESGRRQLDTLFDEVRSSGRAALLPYMTAGLPNAEESVDLFRAMAEAGADGFEIGIPYSDPLMDGPTIHDAGLRALERGVTVGSGIDVARRVTATTGKPVIIMTYANPVLRFGVGEFAARVAEAGAAAVIVADLPTEESVPFVEAFDAVGVGTVLFVAPTTDDARLADVVAADPVFIYGVARLGVTGERDDISADAAALSARVRSITSIPLVLGVGISTPAQASAAAGLGDGVIVGSALVRRVLDAPSAAEAARELQRDVADLAAAVRATIRG